MIYNKKKDRKITIQTKITGQNGEEIAVKYLQNLGYKIIARNVHFSRNCEIDIIAKERNVIVFVEVKTRTTLAFGHPFESINRRKLEKIYQGALSYIQSNPECGKNFRIDGIAVIGRVSPKIEHLKNIGFE